MTTYWLLGERDPPPDTQEPSGNNTLPGSTISNTTIGQTVGCDTLEGSPISGNTLSDISVGNTITSPILSRHQNNISKPTANHSSSITASTPLLQGDSG